MIRLGTSEQDLKRAAQMLREGALVAFPTETVYGLGADAANPDAVARIFRAKGRPAEHPVIVHLPSAKDLPHWASHVPESAHRLADTFWPGPLTLVLRRADGVSDAITGGQETVGLRVPGNPVALALLYAFGGALAAPSANRFGHVSPTTADHVIEEFGDEVAAVVDGGQCSVGVESTIVDLTGSQPRLLRPGMIRVDAIEAELAEPLERVGDRKGPRASGRLASHYSPGAAVELVYAAALTDRIDACAKAGERIAVLARREAATKDANVAWFEMPRQPVQFARAIYAELRRADAARPDRILVEAPPATAGWEAIADRLSRAAAPGGRS
ncbi:MAG: L-threonylcarbamoyladenylate synthase [Wenzhouxiangellaceae bacterium]